jgi:kelch-like protein 20
MTVRARRPSLNTLVVYDPGTGRWENEAPMPTPRSNLKMVYLDPYIYAIGGIGTGPHDPPLNTVERYDPRSGRWADAAPMNIARVNIGTAVVDNQIVVIGGGGDGQDFGSLKPLNSSEVFSPATGTWTLLPQQFPDPGRASLTSAAVGSTVLAIGGVILRPQGGLAVTDQVDRGPQVHR